MLHPVLTSLWQQVVFKNNPNNLNHLKGIYMWILNVLGFYIIQNYLTSDVFLRLRLKSVEFPAFLLNGSEKDNHWWFRETN